MASDLTPTDLSAIEARANAIGEAPRDYNTLAFIYDIEKSRACIHDYEIDRIAKSASDVPALIAVVRDRDAKLAKQAEVIEAMREALEPISIIADLGDRHREPPKDEWPATGIYFDGKKIGELTWGDLRRARAALEKAEEIGK